MNKNNEIDDLNMDNEDSFEDFSFRNVPDIDEKDEKNIKLNALLELDEIPDPPSFIKENLLKNYCKEFRYRILWTKFKDFLARIIYIDRLVINERLVFASVAVLFILITVVYYQYIKPENSPTNIISNQKTPIIPIIKLNPNSTDTPIATPSPIESIDPTVATNPNNNDNIRQDGTKEENNQRAITNEDTKPRKPEKLKDLDKENDKIAMNTVPNNSSATRAVKELSQQQILTMKKLRTLRTIIIDDSLEQDIRQEIEKEIENSPNWEIATDADAMFKVVDNKLMLVNQSGEILWFVNNHKKKYKSKVKYFKYIRSKIKYLSNLSNVENKK